MKRYVYRHGAVLDELVRVEDAVPVVGKDFCSRCGADLAVEGEQSICYDGDLTGDHWWTAWEEEGGRID